MHACPTRRQWTVAGLASLAAWGWLPSTALAAPVSSIALGQLWAKHVKPLRGGVATALDYAAVAGQRPVLSAYLAAAAAVTRAEFDALAKNDQLALLINLYNAATVDLVLTKYPALASIKDLGSFVQSPWKKTFIQFLGETRSLDDVEHNLIRGSGRYNDPRIHFAVNCASVGCPALRAEAFEGARLDAQLDDSARSFLQDRTRNRLDGNTLHVSSIFKWYRQDFEKGWRGANTLAEFFALYASALSLSTDQVTQLRGGKIDIEFLDYDWRLNDTAAGRKP
ncbi:MAG: DUF547 domain-containing protein [Burkholderiaceae bacterium]